MSTTVIIPETKYNEIRQFCRDNDIDDHFDLHALHYEYPHGKYVLVDLHKCPETIHDKLRKADFNDEQNRNQKD